MNLGAGALGRVDDLLSRDIDQAVVEGLQSNSNALILHWYATPALRASLKRGTILSKLTGMGSRIREAEF